MKSLFTFLIIALAGFKTANAQNVGIGTDSPHPSSKLHIDANNAGVLIPSLNLSTVTFPSPGPATGLLVYNSNSSYGQGIGFYFNSGTPAAPVWYKLLDAAYTPTLDEDWFEGNTTDSPDDITDNVYTQGNVGIGNFSSSAPASRLHIKDVINGGRAIDVDMTDGVDANSVGLNIRNFAANANARTGINIDMENTSNSNAVNISNIGPTGMNGININSNSTGNGTGIRIGETTALSTGILIRGGTGVLYNASSDNSGTGISIGGTTRPANGVIARAAGPGTGVVGGSFTDGNEQTSPGRTGVFGFAASSSVSGSEIQYGSYSQSRRGGNSGTTRSYGSYSIAEGVNASNNGLHVGAFGTASVENAGTGGAIAGQFNATSNSGRHLALAATGGADVYLGSTDADRPSNFTGANVNVGSGNTNTTYMHNARLSNQLTFRQTAAGTNTVSIVAPSSVTTSYTMILPTAQGTSNQVLTNDGSGNLSWTNGSSLIGANNGLNITSNNVRLGGSLDASTNIALGNNNLNFTVGSGNTGKVGINTTIPNTYLDIRSNTPKSTTTATEYLFQMGSSANPPLALRQGLAMHSTATNRYASIEVDDDGTKRDLALQPTGGNVGIGVDGIVGTKLYVNDAAGNNLTLERSSTTADDFVGQYFKVHTGTVNTNRKGAIYFQRKAGNGVGNMIFAINNVNSTANVTTADARMTIASSGDVTVHNLGTGLVKSTSGVLSNATGGTDFENPLTFSNGLTRVTNDIKLGGALTEATTISALTGTNKMSFTGTGVDAFNVDGTTFSVDATNDIVGIGTAAPGTSAKLDIFATDKGLLIPRVALIATNSASPVSSPATSLMVYNTATAGSVPNNVTPGYYYWDGAKWARFTESNYNGFDLGYVLGWSSNVAPPDFLLPLTGGTYNWADYPDFQSFNTSYPSQFIASSTGSTFTLVNINTTGRFLRGGTSAGVNQDDATALPNASFTTNTTGAHVHSVDPPATNTNSAGAHDHGRGGTGSVGNGNWGLIQQSSGGNNTTNSLDATPGEPNIVSNPRELGLATDGAHTHSVDIAAFNSASAGDHSHTITGGGDAETRPINTSVVWCLKVKPTSTTGDITIVNTASTAINGLSVYGSAIGLGGNMNQNTTINQGSNSLTFEGTGSFMVNNTGTSNTVVNLTSTGDFDIQDNGTSAFFVRDDGNVGINNNSPTAKLHILVPADNNNNPANNGIYVYNSGNAGDNDDAIIAARVNGPNAGDPFLSLDIDGVTGWSIGIDNSDADKLKFSNSWSDPGSNNRMSITTGGDVSISTLAGTGNRTVYADASGVLRTNGKAIAYSQNRNTFSHNNSNVGYRVTGDATNDLAVTTGDIIFISHTSKFRWTGGSGTDHPFYGIAITGCATTNIRDAERISIADDFSRGNWVPIATNYVWVATCNGNVQFQIEVDNNSDADDNSEYRDIVIVATRY